MKHLFQVSHKFQLKKTTIAFVIRKHLFWATHNNKYYETTYAFMISLGYSIKGFVQVSMGKACFKVGTRMKIY
jgi:hypothetical protein